MRYSNDKMATKKKGQGTAGRFGTRYGRKLREKVSAIEAKQKSNHTCPNCAKDKVSRTAKGIWECKKCKHKFAGKAYVPGEK